MIIKKKKLFKTIFLLFIFVFAISKIEAAYNSSNTGVNNPTDNSDIVANNVAAPHIPDDGLTTDIFANNSQDAYTPQSTDDNSLTENPTGENSLGSLEGTSAETQSGTQTEPPEETQDVAQTEAPEETQGVTQTEAPDGTSTETSTEAPTETPAEVASIEDALVVSPTDAPVTAAAETVRSPYFDDSEYGDPYVNGVLSNKTIPWSFNPNNENLPPFSSASKAFDIRPFGGYYLGDYTAKEIYLTFDEGYENGYSTLILDVLKEKNVKAAFFVTKSYIKQNIELINRMVNEGHIVGNHSVSHKSSPDLSDEVFMNEITETAEYFKEVTGMEMPKYFRPPMGEYSARTIDLTNKLGYKTILWSFAYKDWETDNQPTTSAAFNAITSRMHNGSIILLHAVSEANTNALPDVIDHLRAEGYVFKTLDDLK